MFTWKAEQSFVPEPFRNIRYSPVYFSPILSYISPDAVIGKEQKWNFPWGWPLFKKNDALRIHISGMVVGKKWNCIWVCFSKLHLCFGSKERSYWGLGNNPYRIHWLLHFENILPNADFPSLTTDNSPITPALGT